MPEALFTHIYRQFRVFDLDGFWRHFSADFALFWRGKPH
jgi:hypothetical protein